jgi:branched-chain amino acid transport system ATP-binding protein
VTLLAIESLDVKYGDSQVLWHVSLQVAEGEIVALVGANGAGKTTLLKTLTGLVPSAAGRILWRGADVTRRSAEERVRLGIAMVPEGRRLFAGLSVAENLRLGAYSRDDAAAVPRDFERVFEHFPELGRLRDRLAGTLSGGEQQMCAIGRALMSAPKLLLVDEMSLGLAPVVVERLAAVLAEVNREDGITVLLVEQDVELALEIGQRGYILDTGVVKGEGAADDLLQRVDVRATSASLATPTRRISRAARAPPPRAASPSAST